MKNIRSVLCLTLALLMICLVGCGDGYTYYPVDSEKPDSTTLCTWGDYEIKYELFRFFFYNRHSLYDGGDTALWRGETGDALWDTFQEDALQEICELYAAFEVARSYEIDPFGEPVEDRIHDYIKADIEGSWISGEKIEGYGSQEAYLAGIQNDFHATDAVLRLIYRNSIVLEALYDRVVEHYNGGNNPVDDDTLKLFLNSTTTVRYNHVFISKARYSEEGAALARAEKLLADMRDASSYEEMIQKGFVYSNDIPDTATLEEGMWTTDCVLDRSLNPEYYDTLFSLDVGELSSVIETVDGCYILYCMEKPMSVSSDMRDTLIPLYLRHEYLSRIRTLANEMREELHFKDDFSRVNGVTFLDDSRT